MNIKQIAHIESLFPGKFGVPRQSGMAQLPALIVFEPEYRDPSALTGLEEYSYLWVIWGFSLNRESSESDGWSPTVRPPRLGGNRRVGVFATRSPFRPNPIGLSSVKIEQIKKDPVKGPVICVSGADLADGTPIYDLKPYIGFDCHSDAVCGFSDEAKDYRLRVDFPAHLLAQIPPELRGGLTETLALDPRPAYHDDPDRVYGFPFGNFDVKFMVKGERITVVSVD